jgi:hypothetical protein
MQVKKIIHKQFDKNTEEFKLLLEDIDIVVEMLRDNRFSLKKFKV